MPIMTAETVPAGKQKDGPERMTQENAVNVTKRL